MPRLSQPLQDIYAHCSRTARIEGLQILWRTVPVILSGTAGYYLHQGSGISSIPFQRGHDEASWHIGRTGTGYC